MRFIFNMFRPVNFPNYEKCYPSRLKRYFRSNINYNTYNQFVSETKCAIVGNLPSELIKILGNEKDIKEFQNSLADITIFIRTLYNNAKAQPEFSFYNPKGLYSTLDTIAQNAENVYNKRLEKFSGKQILAHIKYIDRGANANVFKLSLYDKDGNKIMHDKALKVFHCLESKFPNISRKHGNYAEANFWTFLKFWAGHKLDKTQFTKHYISDMKSGYSLTEFIDRGITRTTAPLDYGKMLKIYYLDLFNNKAKLQKLYDAGGFQKLLEFIDDKVVMKNFKKLFHRSEKELPQVMANMKTLIQNPKTPHRDKIQKAIELFEQKLLELK